VAFVTENLPLVVVAVVLLLLLGAVLVSVLPVRGSTPRRLARDIRVIGVGGGGGNAVNDMIRAKTAGVGFIACNTDAQALRQTAAPQKLQIGEEITRGLGAGGDPSIGQRAAEEDSDRIAKALAGSDMVFVTAGLGGGTGSGAAPVIASIARDQGALTIGVVTKPFAFEGERRRVIAEQAAAELRATVDTLITIPNDRVRDTVPPKATLVEAFKAVDEVLRRGVHGIIDIIATPGYVNLDFADVRAVMKDGGAAVLGVGRASGENRAVEAARQAISTSLLEDRMDGATGVLLNVAGSSSLGLDEVTDAAEAVRASAHPDANVIFGASIDRRLNDEVRVTVIATGFDANRRVARPRVAVRAEPLVAEAPVAELPADDATPPAPAPVTTPEATRATVPQPMAHVAPPAGPPSAPTEPRVGPRSASAPPARRRRPPTPANSDDEAPPARAKANGAAEVPLDPDDLDLPSFLRRR
jgi:cell division protein FtsZ